MFSHSLQGILCERVFPRKFRAMHRRLAGPAVRIAPVASRHRKLAQPKVYDLFVRSFATGVKRDPLAALISVCSKRGFIFPSADLYQSAAIGYDYGPHGAQLKQNIVSRWWRDFVTRRRDVVALDSCVLAPEAVWAGSGHLKNFVDPLTECNSCRKRFRADHLVEAASGDSDAGSDLQLLGAAIEHLGRTCPACGAVGAEGLGGKLPRPMQFQDTHKTAECLFTDPRRFNMLFETSVGAVDGGSAQAFLRPETAQGVYTQWRNIHTTTRNKLPIGVASIGRSFRNEISTSNYIFRTREFEQAELQFFCLPEESAEYQQQWTQRCLDWLIQLGVDRSRLRLREHKGTELAHYALATTDIEYEYPFGWGELW